jgi:hypothetical protein
MATTKKKTKLAKKVIKFRQSLFWDVDPKKINPKKHATYIIERILDFGNTSEVKWMRNYYTPNRIKKVVKKSRVLHDKSRSLWSLVFR